MKIDFPVININQYKYQKDFIQEEKKEKTSSSNIDALAYLNNCSLSFQGRIGIPVYAIFKDGSYQKYKSKKEASEDLSLFQSSVCRNSKTPTKIKRDVIFVEARKIETKLHDGTISVDTQKLKELLTKFKQPIYAISPNGEAIKFDTRKAAEETLKLDGPSITHCLQGKVKTVGGYTFVKAKDIERTDEKGNVQLNQEIINSLIYFLNNENAIYSISPDGSYQKFNSQIAALRHYNYSGNVISKCVNGEIKTVHGLTFIRANEIEKQDFSGEIDKLKLEKVLKRFKSPIYAIDEDGNLKKFETQKEAGKKLGLEHSSISACLAGKYNRVGDYTFVRAEEIEEKQEDGTVLISKEKIQEARLKFKSSIYAIDKNGNYTLFATRKDAEETLKLDGPSITHCLRGTAKTVGGYTFIRANEIDTNENIEEQIQAKLEQIFAKKEGSKVIATFPDKTKKEYINAREAAKELGLDPSSIYKNLRGEAKSVQGIIFNRKILETKED